MEGRRQGEVFPYFPIAFTTTISTPTPTHIITAIPPPSVAPNFHRAALQKLSPPGFNPEAPAATHRRNFTAASLDPDQEIQTGMWQEGSPPLCSAAGSLQDGNTSRNLHFPFATTETSVLPLLQSVSKAVDKLPGKC